ncbi:hypothetical protein SBA7_410017 [Candidatus Sulfotelmatobacter sp. SbA7]|nr:hypothetical protein SBA7_410017 [Candidatus Sulfotelmatobacter sp. SbA7]
MLVSLCSGATPTPTLRSRPREPVGMHSACRHGTGVLFRESGQRPEGAHDIYADSTILLTSKVVLRFCRIRFNKSLLEAPWL